MLNAILRSVAMMNINIQNGNSLEERVLRARIGRSDRHIIEQTEALTHRIVIRVVDRAVGTDVMTWRTNTAEYVAIALVKTRRKREPLPKSQFCATHRRRCKQPWQLFWPARTTWETQLCRYPYY